MRGWACGALIAFAVVVAAAAAAGAGAQDARPYAVEDAISMRRFTWMAPIQLSPDGRLVAYSLVDVYSRTFSTKEEARTDRGVPQVMSGSELLVTELANGRTRRIAGGRGRGSAWGATWSPKGRELAFLSDDDGEVSLWVWARELGRSRRATRAVMRPDALDVPRWTPDGRRVVVKTRGSVPARRSGAGAGDGPRPRVQQFTYRPDSAATRLDTRERARLVASRSVSDLSVIDVASGAVRVLARDEPIVGYWISPRGQSVAYSRLRTDVRGATNANTFDLIVLSLESGISRVIARGIAHPTGLTVSWAPDGSHLAFISTLGAEGDTSDVLPRGFYVVRENGDSLRLIGLSNVSSVGIFDVPLWDGEGQYIYAVAEGRLVRLARDGSGGLALKVPRGREVLAAASRLHGGRLWLSDDGKHAVVVTRDTLTLRQGLARVPLDGGEPEIIDEGEQMLLGSAATNPEVFRLDALGDRLLVVRETALEPPDLWLYEGAARRRVTRVNPEHSAYRFGASRLVTWLSDDGVPLRGAVILPPDYTPTKRYPLLVCIYGGGRLSRAAFSFGGFLPSVHHAQLFATRGFAVFFPDAPQQFGTPLQDLAKTILPGVSRLVEMGIADEDRLAIMGHSYGGYSVYSVITQTTRFRAAVVSAGASNLTSAYGIMIGTAGMEEYFEGGQGKIGASLWEARERYIENSPIFHFDRVRTPVLIVHGARDSSVPVWMADAAFLALRRLGREVEYVRYLDEEHSEWTGPASADMAERMLAFLSTHVGSTRSGVTSAAGEDAKP